LNATLRHQGNRGFETYLGATTPQFGPTGFTGYTFTPTNFAPSEGILSPRSQAYVGNFFIRQAGRTGERIQGQPFTNNNFWGVLAEFNLKAGPGAITVLPAYRRSTLDNLITPGMNGAGTTELDEQFSLEARYAGSVGPVDFVIGAFYFKEDVATTTYFSQFTVVPYQDLTNSTKSYAGFGKLTWHATDNLSLTAAGRFTEDSKRFDGVSDTYILFCGNPAARNTCPTLPFIPLVPTAADLRAFYAGRGIPVVNVPLFVLPPFLGGSQTAPFVLNSPTRINADLKNDKFTYRLAAEYQLGSQSMIYASYETGYHSGGFAFAKGLETYRPETIQAWTIGSKNRFFGNKVQLNVEGFYWKYKDQQFSQFGYDLGTPPTTVFLTRNVGRSTIYGIDLDAQWLVTEHTLLSGNVQYVNTNYDSFVYDVPNQGLPPVTTCGFQPLTTPINGIPTAVYRVDCSGQKAINTPTWSFNLNAQQTIPLGGNKVVLQAGTRYRASAQQDPAYSLYGIAKAGTNTNASVTYSPDDETWSITAFVNNIEDFRRVFAVSQVAASGVYIGAYEAPRTYGIRIGAKFR